MSALRMTPMPHRERSEAERASAWFCWISQIVFVSSPFLDFVPLRGVFRSSGLNVFYFVCRWGKHIHSAAACAGCIKWKLTGYSMKLWLIFFFFRLFCQSARCTLTGVAASLTFVWNLCNALGLTCWNLINCLERPEPGTSLGCLKDWFSKSRNCISHLRYAAQGRQPVSLSEKK